MKPNGELIIVDYKATSKEDEVTLDGGVAGRLQTTNGGLSVAFQKERI
ncbi:MAG: hypothetical protein WC285_05150 [Candidatus Gracilibacteria bacterium]